MSDRTHVRIWIPLEIYEKHQSDIDEIMEYGFSNEGVTADKKFMLFKDDEADCGGSHVVGELVDREFPFAGQHDSGDEYEAVLFVYDGETKVEIPMDTHGDHYVHVKVYRGKVTVDAEALEDIERFRDTIRSFNDKFGNPHMACFGDFVND